MQNIDVRFNATSNFGKTRADLAALQAQAAALGAVFSQGAYARPPQLVDPNSWRTSTRAVNEASRIYRDAASSSGLLTTQQIRATSETERYTRALQKQKLGFKEMLRHRGIMREVYRDQLRFQRMTAQYWGTDTRGRAITDISIPRNVPTDLDNMRRRMGMFGNMAASAGTQVINLGKNIQWAGRQLTVGFTYPAALFGAAAGLMAFKVEDAFAKINKVYDVSAGALTNEALRTKELGEVRVRSIEMATQVAKEYGITVEKTLAVEQELAATGLAGDKLLSATREVQRISALGDIDPSATTDMVVALQTAFRNTIKTSADLSNVLNFMNATSNATSLSLQDIAEATPRAASGLAQLGVTAQEMTIMLVSMREAGVDAAEGANALKSATTRILNPVTKAKDIYAEYGINLERLSKQSGGNLFEFLKLLGAEQQKINGQTEKETKRLRAQGVAALFGTYQYNRLNAALVNIGDAYGGVNNQTAKAIDLQNLSNESLAHQAKISQDLMMNNPAGKLKKAWAEFQIELSEMGGPFLEAASQILTAFSAVGNFFNGLADWKKSAIMWTLAILALTGPVIMLTGLFFNLFGQFIKGGGAIMRFIGISKLLTKEEQAAILTAEAQNRAMQQQQATTSTLAQEIGVLTAAYQRATAAARQLATVQGVPGAAGGAPVGAGFIGPQTRTITGGYQLSSREQSYFSRTAEREQGRFRSNAARLDEARNRMANDYMRSMNLVARDATVTQQRAAQEARVRERIRNSVGATSVAMGAMSLAMAGMLLGGDSMIGQMSKWLLIATLVVPAIKLLAGYMAMAATASWGFAKGVWASVAAARASTAATGGMVASLTAARGAAIGLGASINAALGPVGWIALGITAISAGAYIWYNHQKKIKEEQREIARNQASLVTLTDQWAESMGTAVNKYKQYVQIGATEEAKAAFRQDVEFYMAEEQRPEMEQYGGFGIDEKAAFDTAKYIDLIKKADMTAAEAERHMSAFFYASGESIEDAKFHAEGLRKELGNLKGINWREQLAAGMENLYASTEELEQGNADKVNALGKQLGNIYNEAFLSAANPQESVAVFEQMKTKILQPWEELRSKLRQDARFDPNEPMLQSAEALRQAYLAMDEDQRKAAFSFQTVSQVGADSVVTTSDSLLKAAINAEALERALIGGIAEAGTLGTEIFTIEQYTGQAVIMAQMLSYAEARDEAKQLMENLWNMNQILANPLLGNGRAAESLKELMMLADPGQIEELSQQLNALADANGIKRGATALETYNNILNNVKVEAKDAGKEVKDIGRNLEGLRDKTVNIRIKQVGGIIQDAMSGVQSDMADSAMDAFNTRWDASMDRMANAHEAAQDRMEQRQQAAMDAFDERWEKRRDAVEAAYDKRIEAISREIDAEQRADEARQRMFEKEKERLQRLAEMQNTNIDFNTALTEGRLDEAAKIMNNAGVAGANAQMDAEQQAAEARSQARIEALEKKTERLEKQRDKEIKQLEKMEERMRKHLERIQNARANALQRQQEQTMNSLQTERDYEEAMLEQRLELFKSYTARNQEDLERWMTEVGLSYDDFGEDVKAKGEAWSTYFQQSLSDHIRQAGMEVMNDNMWEDVGKTIANKLLKGLGFDNLAEFNKFVKTGTKTTAPETRHEGGIVGSGGGSRGNIPNTFRGLHRSEKMIRAQKGEYVVNRNASMKHKGLLDAINNGTDVPGVMGGQAAEPIGMSKSWYGGPAALMSGVIAGMFAQGVGKAFNNAYAVGLGKGTVPGGKFTGTAGDYGGIEWSAEQIKNAAIIASVGAGMGMSTRDLEIGIMTAITESMLRNIAYGDRDSVGLFQQRTSQGWGSVEQIMNPRYAAGKFFSALKGVDNRDAMTPWMAAQSVQRSFDPTGSNYAKYWGAAQAIFTKGLKKVTQGGVVAGYVPGQGRNHRPISGAVTSGLHGQSTGYPAVDMAGPSGRSVYAVSDGVISRSYDIAGPLPTDSYKGSGPYGSYGRVIYLKTDAGPEVLYAHLSRRSVTEGQRVSGGAVIGYSGNTGNSSGPHLHFGATNGPYAWLRRGGTVRYDNTPAYLHKGETVLTQGLTKQFKDNVAGGSGNEYNVTIDLRGAYVKEDVDIKGAVKEAIHEMENKVGRKRTVR